MMVPFEVLRYEGRRQVLGWGISFLLLLEVFTSHNGSVVTFLGLLGHANLTPY